jgi:hypothetical protein
MAPVTFSCPSTLAVGWPIVVYTMSLPSPHLSGLRLFLAGSYHKTIKPPQPAAFEHRS